jgi:hypothetical protein
MKRAAYDLALLAKELGAPKIVLGGHDWYFALILPCRDHSLTHAL